MSTTDVLKPFNGPPIGGQRPAHETVLPIEGGGVVRLSPEAQVASKASIEFAQAFPNYEGLVQGKRGLNNLDSVSAGNLEELRRQMRSTPPKPATVINLHPWPLTFDGNSRFLRGLVVPACEPGMPFSYAHFRGYRTDWKYDDDTTFKFGAVLPIHQAGEFLRTFGNRDLYGGGVLIYEGEGHPDKVDEVELYDPLGRVLTRKEPGVEYDEEQHEVRVMRDISIHGKLGMVLAETRKIRNNFYLQRVKRADQDYRLPDGRGKGMVTELHMKMADVLVYEGLITKVPEWDLKGRMEEGLADSNCKACGASPRADSFKCVACGHIMLPFEAYMAGEIQYGHASMELLTADEWESVETEKARRDEAKRAGRERAKAARATAKKTAAEAAGETIPAADVDKDED